MKKFLILLTALACLLAGCGSPGSEPTEPPLPTLTPNPYRADDFVRAGGRMTCLAGESIPGIDVSSHQGTIDWTAVAADGIEFAMIRVGYRGYGNGQIVEDTAARANIEGALAAGLKVGVYFFSQATTPREATQEASFVINFINGYDISMPVVFDWEHVESPDARTAAIQDKTLLTSCALAYLRMVKTAGYTPMVYFNNFQSEELLDLLELRDYDFWLAMYDTRMTFPYQIRMWQYSNQGSVAGINEKVDMNLYFPD